MTTKILFAVPYLTLSNLWYHVQLQRSHTRGFCEGFLLGTMNASQQAVITDKSENYEVLHYRIDIASFVFVEQAFYDKQANVQVPKLPQANTNNLNIVGWFRYRNNNSHLRETLMERSIHEQLAHHFCNSMPQVCFALLLFYN